MPRIRALQIHAGPLARRHLLERGLQPQDIRVVAGAAGGPKGLTLLPLDRFIFGHWLAKGGHAVDLVGASIGAWRMAAACTPDPQAAFERLGHDYIHERYGDEPGRMPSPEQVSHLFSQTLHRHFAHQKQTVLSHPMWRLHVLTSRGRGPLRHPHGRALMGLGFAAAVACNAWSRRALSLTLQRVCFSASGQAPPWLHDDIDTAGAVLTVDNFEQALLASCTIPFWLRTVWNIPQAPAGPYWDGGLTDYHVHLPYDRLESGLALVPHFQPRLVPGWLDKPLRHRHGATTMLDRAIVLSPTREWIDSLPARKIPDRSDFKRHLHEPATRERLWRQALQASSQLADEWADCVSRGSIESLPLP